MGADSWNALSESTKSFFVEDRLRNANSNSASNHENAMPARQKSMRRGGGGRGGSSSGGGHSQSSFTHPPLPPQFPIFAISPDGHGNLVPVMPYQSPGEPPYRGNNWEARPVGGFGPQPPVVNYHRHSLRRGNYGPLGDGPYRNNSGGRRNQDRGHYGNIGDAHVHPQRSPRGFVRPPTPNAASFVPPQPVRPFANPMGFSDFVYTPMLPLETFRMPFITHARAPAMIVPVHEPPLPAMLVHQIEYYFSDANLIRDEFLKSNMDNQGWVPITLIAGFNRVKSMTKDIQLILDSLRTSTLLEVQNDKVRRLNDWMKWTRISSRIPTDSGIQSSIATSPDVLTKSFQKMTLEGITPNQTIMMVKPSPNSQDVLSRSSSDLPAQSQIFQQEVIEGGSSS